MENLETLQWPLVEIRSMRMEVQPPWANELRARNRKVGRSIWSTSDTQQEKTSFNFEFQKGHGDDDEMRGIEETKVVDPLSSSSPKGSTTVLRGGTSIHDKTSGKPFWKENLISEEEMRGNLRTLTSSGEESIIEYGPGIVSKLRSKYQTLSSRSSPIRPTLRRSTSLEHSLNLIQLEPPTTSPSPESRDETPSPPSTPVIVNIPEGKGSARPFRGAMTLNIRPIYENKNINNKENSASYPERRGRLGSNEQQANRQNRMRRARSVDALHHGEYTTQEEEILEKFKTVVLPKEEVVIIEMSKPRLNIGSLGTNTLLPPPLPPSKVTNELNIGNSGAVTGTNYYALSTLISPEHELPPHDIVRETARLFETNPGIQWKRIGHVLRFCKSSSVSPSSSVCSSPTPTPVVASAPEKKIQIVPTQSIRSAAIYNHNEDSNLKIMNNIHQNNKLASKSSSQGSNSTGGVGNIQISPVKQVGVIRPTVNRVQKSSSSSTLSREVTPAPPMNRAFQFITPKKPPLSPKPILTSKSSDKIENGVEISTIPRNVVVNGSKEKSSERGVEIVPPPPRLSSPVSVSVQLKVSSSPTPTIETNLKSSDSDSNLLTSSKTASPILIPKIGSPTPISKTPSPIPTLKPGDEVVPEEVNKVNTLPVTLKPVLSTTKINESFHTRGKDFTTGNITSKVIPSESQKSSNKQPYNDTTPLSMNTSTIGTTDTTSIVGSLLKEKIREGDALKKQNKNITSKKEDEASPHPVSQLRTHQKQKSQQSNGGGTMVFNFTSRNKVPDYIEDDGIRRMNMNGSVMDESSDDALDGGERIDPKLIDFIGANVIINGKSSIQKKAKLKKMSIRFNEEGTTTFEYPSESSILAEDEETTGNPNTSGQPTPNNNLVGKSPTAMNLSGGGGGGALSSYTPSKVAPNSYQLGFYRENSSDSNSNRKLMESGKRRGDELNREIIEDYLKPDATSTTWSNELGAADILF